MKLFGDLADVQNDENSLNYKIKKVTAASISHRCTNQNFNKKPSDTTSLVKPQGGLLFSN